MTDPISGPRLSVAVPSFGSCCVNSVFDGRRGGVVHATVDIRGSILSGVYPTKQARLLGESTGGGQQNDER
jgi:hypothetical protein